MDNSSRISKMSKNPKSEYADLKDFLDEKSFSDFLLEAEPYLNQKSNTLKNSLINILEERDFILAKGIQSSDDFAFCILKDAIWETEIINKKCATLKYFFGTNLEVCQSLIKNIFDELSNNYFFIQHDSHFAPSHVEISLQEAGFHTGAHYYSWEGFADKINRSALSFADRFDIQSAHVSQADEIKSFAKYCEKSWIDTFFHFPGRFVADPYMQKYGINLYSNWAYNSVLNESNQDEVLICNVNGKMAGYVVLKYLDNKTVNLGILRIDPDYKGKMVGVALQSASVAVPISKGCKRIITRTAKFNVDNNKLLDNLGLKIINSGLQFHFINKAYKS